MKVAVYGQFYHENSAKFIKVLLQVLREQEVTIVIAAAFHDILRSKAIIAAGDFQCFSKLSNDIDLFFSIGGDGTILSAVEFINDTVLRSLSTTVRLG